MSLYVRQSAWLGAAPEKSDTDKSKALPVSRIRSLRELENDDEFTPPMPDPGAAAYLLGHFWAIGPSSGEVAITQGELRNYQINSGIALSPWECSTLHQMSVAHINESQRATKYGCEAPWTPEGEAEIKIDQYLKEKRAQENMRKLAKG